MEHKDTELNIKPVTYRPAGSERRRPAPAPREPDLGGPAEEAQVSRRGRIAAIAVALLAALALGTYCGWRYWVAPSRGYEAAAALLAREDWEAAAAAFDALGSFRDSPDRAREARLRQGFALMEAGAFDAALNYFRDLGEGYEAQAADCLYAAAVQFYNGGDFLAALTCGTLLAADYPADGRSEALIRICSYSLGGQQAAQAAQVWSLEEKLRGYRAAAAYFEAAGDYADSPQRLAECRARIAQLAEAVP